MFIGIYGLTRNAILGHQNRTCPKIGFGNQNAGPVPQSYVSTLPLREMVFLIIKISSNEPHHNDHDDSLTTHEHYAQKGLKHLHELRFLHEINSQ